MNRLLTLMLLALTAIPAVGAAPSLPFREGTGVGSFSPDTELNYCVAQVRRALAGLQRPDGSYDYTLMPRNILEGQRQWNTRKASAEEWCSGFWPGILWMAYEASGDEAIAKQAAAYTQSLGFLARRPAYDHDLGFLIINSFLKGLYAHESREAAGLQEYEAIALAAADTLATLFNSTVGTILSWPRHVKDYGGHNTIMDNMINLELLFWAARHSGSHRLYDIAVRHAETTMKHHFRPDGSCYHVAVYDTLDGHFLRGVTHQGYHDQSMWARGQSWAIYGYTMVYRFTHDRRFLRHAQKCADIYIKRLGDTSDDLIPRWDMDDPYPRAPKDASAACVVASALLELSQYVDSKSASSKYLDFATESLRQLSTDRYQSRNRNVAFLLHSTGHHPTGSEIDASIVYADYYYLEALLRYKKLTSRTLNLEL